MIKKHKKTILIFLAVIFFLILAFFVFLFTYQRAYAGKIYHNVYFGEIDLSGRTKTQAEYILQNKFDTLSQEQITLSSGEKSINVALRDTGINFDFQKIIDDCYSIGRNGNFIANLESSTKTIYSKTPIVASVSFDQEKYDKFVEVSVQQFEVTATDAALKIDNGQIVSTDSSSGVTVDTETLKQQLIDLMSSSDTVIDLVTATTNATTTAVNLDSAKTQAEKYLSAKISFTYNGKNYSPTRAQIGAWLEFKNENSQIVCEINNDNVKAYLATVAKNFEVTMKNKKVNASTGEVIEAGQDGISLNKDDAVTTLKNQLNTSATITVALTTTTVAAKETKVSVGEGVILGRFEGKYIDVDLTKQQLCRIEGGTLIDCFTVSTGKASMPTPTGTYSILSKNPRQWSATYSLWMPWWQQWYGSYGIHELPEWPNGYKEGESHLGTPVSHGCIRLGVGPAETVYNWTEIGTPVYIHK